MLGPLTNPNLMQAYNYQELMNKAGGTVSTPSMALNQSGAQGRRGPFGVITVGGLGRPTSAAVRPQHGGVAQGRSQHAAWRGGPAILLDEQAVYGVATSAQAPPQLHASAAHIGGVREVLDLSQEAPS